MGRLIHAELLKLRTTQVWFWLLMTSIALSLLIVFAALAPHNGIQNVSDVAALFSSAATSDTPVFVLGVLGITTEFRYQTITPTVLGTPSRWALVTAKMITYALVGAVYSAICLGLQIAVAIPWLSAKHISGWATDSHVVHAMLGVFGVVALFGVIGLGVGTLLKNQIVAVSVGLVFLFVLQNILLAIPKVKNAYPFTPGGASAALLSTGSQDLVNGVRILPALSGLVILLLWALVPAILGATITLNRDIT
jgi:ABC-2 type transport system permease protein